MDAPRSRSSDRAGWGIALLAFALIAWPALILPDEALLTSFTDDTYYYLVVARHVAAGNGFTFDGLHPTNGYQPLWLFLLVPLYVVLPGEFPPLRGLILLQAVILAAAAILPVAGALLLALGVALWLRRRVDPRGPGCRGGVVHRCRLRSDVPP